MTHSAIINSSPDLEEHVKHSTILPLATQQMGHTALPQPDQETPTTTAPQHRGHTAPAPLTPNKAPLLLSSNHKTRVFTCFIYQL